VTKLKVLPSRWGEENLHRHHDFAPIKKEAVQTSATGKDTLTERCASPVKNTSGIQSPATITDLDDEYGGDLFEEVDFHPDEVTLIETSMLEVDTSNIIMAERPAEMPLVARQPISKVQSGPGQPQGGYQQGNSVAANQAQTRQQTQQRPGQVPNSNMSNRPLQNGGRMQPPAPQQQAQQTFSVNQPINNDLPIPHDVPVGFITARGAEIVQATNVPLPQGVPIFNPHADSPSIRKTTGVNHNRSGPITRQTVGVAQPVGLPAGSITANCSANAGNSASLATGGVVTPSRVGNTPSNFINPQADVNRRIGMPPGVAMQSPVANRSAYKPPGPAQGVKRALAQENDGGAGVKAPLADVSNLQGQGQTGVVDGKRLKVDGR
jgi:DNA repair and recombination protein RAD52